MVYYNGIKIEMSNSVRYINTVMPVMYGSLGRSANDNQNLIQEFMDRAAWVESTNNVLRTDWNTHLEHSDICGELMQQILDWYIDNVCHPTNEYELPDLVKQDRNLAIDAQSWFQYYPKGSKSKPHEHGVIPGYSFVYYLKANNTPPLKFLESFSKDNIVESKDFVEFEVKDDTIVFFPMQLIHGVDPTHQERAVFAGNLVDVRYATEYIS